MDGNDKSYGGTFAGFSEAFGIFAKYSEKYGMVYAEHDEVCASLDPSVVSPEDTERLSFLRWQASEGGEGFIRIV